MNRPGGVLCFLCGLGGDIYFPESMELICNLQHYTACSYPRPLRNLHFGDDALWQKRSFSSPGLAIHNFDLTHASGEAKG